MPTMLKQFRDSLHSRIAPENPCHPRFKALLCLFAHMACNCLREERRWASLCGAAGL